MSQTIINMTQHAATPEQIAAGVVDIPEPRRSKALGLLTFDFRPRASDLRDRAAFVAMDAVKEANRLRADGRVVGAVMIGGAPFFMAALEEALIERGFSPVYAFSRRESVDQPQPDGSVRKVQTFRHAGFVPAIGLKEVPECCAAVPAPGPEWIDGAPTSVHIRD